MFVELRVLCAGGTRLAPTGVDTETAEHRAIRGNYKKYVANEKKGNQL